jgi:ribosomal protein L19
MSQLRKAVRSNALLSSAVEVHEVDGVALSEEEVNLAKRLIDKLAMTEKGGVIDIRRASKWGLRQRRGRKNSPVD